MVNPRVKCKVEPSPHAKVRMADRSLSQSDIERIVRGGVWIAEGGTDYDVTYQRWHIGDYPSTLCKPSPYLM